MGVCLLGTCCPCYLFGQNAEQIDGSNKFAMCCGNVLLHPFCLMCLLHKPRREKLRGAYGLVEKPNDWIAACICAPCAHCQEAQELKHHGKRFRSFFEKFTHVSYDVCPFLGSKPGDKPVVQSQPS